MVYAAWEGSAIVGSRKGYRCRMVPMQEGRLSCEIRLYAGFLSKQLSATWWGSSLSLVLYLWYQKGCNSRKGFNVCNSYEGPIVDLQALATVPPPSLLTSENSCFNWRKLKYSDRTSSMNYEVYRHLYTHGHMQNAIF